MARLPTPTFRPPELTPTASPVDTFTAPAKSPLTELAERLAPLDKQLGAFLDERAQKFRKEQDSRAVAQRAQANGIGYAEAVRTGVIPAQASGSFVRAWKRMDGEAMGQRLRAEYQQAWDNWDGKDNDDPQAFDSFFQEFVRSRVTTEDPDVLEGLLPTLHTLNGQAYDAQINYRSKEVYASSLTAHLATTNGMIDEADTAGLASGTGTDYAALGTAIEQKRNAWIESGGRAADFDSGIMQAVAGKAIELRDPKLLDFFSRKVPGQTYTYGDTPEGAKIKQDTIESLTVLGNRAVTQEAAEQDKRDKQELHAVQSSIIGLLSTGEDVPEELIARGERLDGLLRTRIGEWRKNLSEAQRNPAMVRQVMSEIMDGGGMQAVLDAASDIRSVEDLTQLHTFAKGFEQAKGRIEDAMTSPSVQALLKAIDARTKAKDEMGLEPLAGMSNEGLEAQYDLKRRISEWVQNNPSATYQETEEAIGAMGKAVLERVTAPEDGNGGTYERDPEAPFDNPFTDAGGQAHGARQNSGQQTPQDYYLGMTPEQREQTDKDAAAHGMTRDDWVRTLQEKERGLKAPSAPDGTPVDPISYRPDDVVEGPEERPVFTREMAQGILESALAAADDAPAPTARLPDAKAGRILDLIAQPESGGNYNAVYGNAKSSRDLSAYTLDDIMAQQASAKRRGAASTAIGRYQFLQKTLASLKQELRLTGKERFTPALQDRLGFALLERRGYTAFKEGRLSKRQFALRLSQEWAALPDPSTGRSFYAGDGVHGRAISPRDVYAAMGFPI